MQMIEDLRTGDGFKHYYRLAIDSENAQTPESEWRKMYRTMNDMDTVVKKYISFCPNLDTFIPNKPFAKGNKERAKKQQKLAKRALKKIKWRLNINEVYDSLETKGDVFFYIYFESKDDKIPRLKYLEPRNMSDIILDDNGEPMAYIYKEIVAKQVIDSRIGKAITVYQREVTWVFEKGKTTIIDPMYEEKDGLWYSRLDDKGVQIYDYQEIFNRASYEDDIAIIRIQSYKKFNEKFSRIPASAYIDHCLALDGINSNISQINIMLGYPVTYIINGSVTGGERKPSGFIYVESDSNPENLNSKPEIVISQITNDLESLFRQKRAHEDALYDLCGLVNKTAQEKLGNTDSARVVATYEAPKKNKIELYVDNIIDPFQLYFKILFKENDLWNDEIDEGVSLYKPKHLSQISIFDEQLYDQNAINLGSKTKGELALQNGDDIEDLENREQQQDNIEINNETANDVRSNNN